MAGDGRPRMPAGGLDDLGGRAGGEEPDARPVRPLSPDPATSHRGGRQRQTAWRASLDAIGETAEGRAEGGDHPAHGSDSGSEMGRPAVVRCG